MAETDLNLNLDYVRQLFETTITEDVATCPVQYENVDDSTALERVKTAKTAWVRITIRDGDAFSMSLGSKVTRRYPGLCIVTIFVPQGGGTEQIRNIGSKINNEVLQIREVGVRILSPYIIIIGKSEDWFQGNLHIPYEIDQTTS